MESSKNSKYEMTSLRSSLVRNNDNFADSNFRLLYERFILFEINHLFRILPETNGYQTHSETENLLLDIHGYDILLG